VKNTLWLVIIPAVLIAGPCTPLRAQKTSPSAPAAEPSAAAKTGQLDGSVHDPTGALVHNAEVIVTSLSTGTHTSMKTGPDGHFHFRALPSGSCRITVRAAGFQIAVVSLAIASGRTTTTNVSLRIGRIRSEVEVEAQASGRVVSQHNRDVSQNAADLLSNIPGISLRGNGQLASIPMLHGLGDARTKVVVNGMTVSPSCANHMNPPLTYLPPSQAAHITVIAGITPVSEGGDSIAGTISIQSAPPAFAAPGKRLYEQGSASSFYRSNGDNYGGAVSGWIAGRSLGIGYSGSWTTGKDYTDGSGATITSTYARSNDNTVRLAARRGSSVFVLDAGLHRIPYQGFVNDRMDMLDNQATRLNFHYRGSFSHGIVDAHVYYQNTAHTMNIGHDKATFPMPMYMPMNSHGTDTGYTLKYELPLSARHTLRVGNELHRFVLNDSWAPVAGKSPMMGPNTFVDIDNGRRTRVGTYAEIASLWDARWTTLFGIRNDTIWSNTGPVHGYSMMYATDAAAFNAASRARTDADFDATALVRYRLSHSADFDIGYARKSRAPSLFERYAWSTNTMASSMIGWFGDGNDYVGNLNLKPEIAHTLSGTVTLHGGNPARVEVKATPYVTWIHNYVDVNRLKTIAGGVNTFAQLQFANHSARIGGLDLSGDAALWNTSALGKGSLTAVAGWLQGVRRDDGAYTGTGLYDIMPVHVRVEIDQTYKHWRNGIAVQAVDRKSDVDPLRFERQTPGYVLFSLRTAYRQGPLRVSAGATNLLNREYELPLGGVNMDRYLADEATARVEPVTGPGRSVYGSLALRF
jgi:iron complex outermembrane receptor protein